jgi:hypothetical protein
MKLTLAGEEVNCRSLRFQQQLLYCPPEFLRLRHDSSAAGHSDLVSSTLGSISPIRLGAAFTHADPKSTKRQLSHQCLFALLGPAHVKASCKMLVKLTPVVGNCYVTPKTAFLILTISQFENQITISPYTEYFITIFFSDNEIRFSKG